MLGERLGVVGAICENNAARWGSRLPNYSGREDGAYQAHIKKILKLDWVDT